MSISTRIGTQVRETYFSYLALWVGLILLSACLYFVLSYVPGHGSLQIEAAGSPLNRFLVSLYLSVITGATVGYGDVLPLGFSRVIAGLESIISFILLALFVARVSSRQQDAALNDIHSLARDSLFNNFRHGLFIARKDLDKIVESAQGRKKLSEHDWKNIRIAFRQMHTQIDNIPQLYGTGGDSIDEDHEQLILDSVERSLRRARETVELLNELGTSCNVDERCTGELQSIVTATHVAFVTLFGRAYNAENDEAFQEMLEQLTELKAVI